MTRTRLLPVGVLCALAGAVAVGAWFGLFRPAPPASTPEPPSERTDDVADPPPPDPRLTFPTVFRNVKPDVSYVGDASCADCHGKICTSYHAHPMGRSAELITRAPVIEKYDAGAVTIGPYQLSVGKDATGVTHRVTAKDAGGAALPAYTVSADVAIGSGIRGRSYLSVESGTVWQTPISWFSAEARWDVSPGFDLGTGGRRAIIPACLFCHVDRVEPVPHTINRYREPLFPRQAAIGCERCHGPGALHVAERTERKPAEKVDTSIVNPKHLSPALQTSICEQCHLQGQERVTLRGRSEFEFRPGLPFSSFVTVFVRHPDLVEANRSVGQFEQLEESRCTTATGGRLLCTSCHDPHTIPAAAERDRFYRDRCNVCHNSKGCTAPPADRTAKNDSCTACHMPRAGSSNIAHASITDHRILRRPVAPVPPRGLAPGDSPLVVYRAATPPERDRALGIALARVAGRLPAGGAQSTVGRLARDELRTSLGLWRGDAEAWAAMSAARGATGEPDERITAAERALRLAPGSEPALVEVAAAALVLGRFDRAEEAATALVALTPRSVEHRMTRATVLVAQKKWEAAEAECRAALQLHPLHPQARLVLGVCLHHRGAPAAGRQEADTAAALATHPRQRKAIQEWYDRETR